MEKLDFFDASRIVAGTDRGIRYKQCQWNVFRYLVEGCGLMKRDGSKEIWWPESKQMGEKVWEVEPEKPKEAFVWGVRDEDGTCRVMNSPATGANKPPNKGLRPWAEIGGFGIDIPENNVFSKMARKYRLVPADETWPWRKFDPEEMPEKGFEFLALMQDGAIWIDKWINKPRNGGLWRANILEMSLIDAYIPFDEIPKPETP